MGENITSEWLRDDEADMVWDALQLVRKDPGKGMAKLLELAKVQSSLAMMYAGNIYSKGRHGIPKNLGKGKALLSKSFEFGSIEGGFQLGNVLMAEGDYEESLAVYRKVSDLNYAPAKYALGYYYSFGSMEYRNPKKGIGFFQDGALLGHFPSKVEFVKQSIKQNQRYYDIVKGLFIRSMSALPHLYIRLTYPNSDRLRV